MIHLFSNRFSVLVILCGIYSLLTNICHVKWVTAPHYQERRTTIMGCMLSSWHQLNVMQKANKKSIMVVWRSWQYRAVHACTFISSSPCTVITKYYLLTKNLNSSIDIIVMMRFIPHKSRVIHIPGLRHCHNRLIAPIPVNFSWSISVESNDTHPNNLEPPSNFLECTE